MTRIAFVFPGQAAQRAGMASAWAGTPSHAAFEIVGAAAGIDLAARADDEQACAGSTALAQPAIFAASIAALTALRDAGISASVVAGHSLGEITAAVAAGTLALHDAAALVAERGRAMGAACAARAGAMAAVLRLELAAVEAITAEVPDAVVANANAPGQTVVAGPPDAIERVAELVAAAGGRTRELRVEGAFHSPAMTPAMVRVDAVLRRTHLFEPNLPLVAGIDGRRRATAAGIRRALVEGVLAPVRWIDVQRELARHADLLIEVGPGGILAGCAKRTIDLPVASVATPADVASLVEQLDRHATVRVPDLATI